MIMEKQLQQVMENKTETVNIPSRMELELESLLSDRCENCGIRPKASVGRETKKWCSRCIGVYQRKTSPQKAMKHFIECVGEAYSMADLEQIDFRDKLESAKGDIFLYGDIGAGKTYAMAALIKKFFCEGFECRRINFDDFCCKVRSTMNSRAGPSEYDLIRDLSDVDKLFIDDIGIRSKQETDFAYVTLYSILNKRQERWLPTYITTNKSIEQLSESFDERIASRLRLATVVHLAGKDRRL